MHSPPKLPDPNPPWDTARLMDRFTTSDGVAIAYDFDDSAPGDAPPVVLLHGFAVSGILNFGGPGLIDGLADADRKTLVVDARGHGESDTPHDPALYGEQRMADDVQELIDELSFAAYDLVGYSMGSVTAAILAAQDPRVRRLVLGGVGAGVVERGGLDDREMPRELVAQAMRAKTARDAEHPLGAVWRGFADSVEADPIALACQIESSHRTPIALDQITAATMVLAASKDGLANRPQTLAGAIKDAQYRVIEGDHLGVVRHPDWNPAIIDWLAVDTTA